MAEISYNWLGIHYDTVSLKMFRCMSCWTLPIAQVQPKRGQSTFHGQIGATISAGLRQQQHLRSSDLALLPASFSREPSHDVPAIAERLPKQHPDAAQPDETLPSRSGGVQVGPRRAASRLPHVTDACTKCAIHGDAIQRQSGSSGARGEQQQCRSCRSRREPGPRAPPVIAISPKPYFKVQWTCKGKQTKLFVVSRLLLLHLNHAFFPFSSSSALLSLFGTRLHHSDTPGKQASMPYFGSVFLLQEFMKHSSTFGAVVQNFRLCFSLGIQKALCWDWKMAWWMEAVNPTKVEKESL